MRRRACAALAVINFLLIAVNIIVIPVVYNGVYKTFLFWGINLYVATSSILMIINRKEPRSFIWLNAVLTIISFAWLIMYLPKFTPQNAVNYISSREEFRSAKDIYIDSSNPVNPDIRGSLFVKGGYNVIADYGSSKKVFLSFNPVSGSYKTTEDNERISSSLMLFDNTFEKEYEFEEKYKLVKDDFNKLKSLLIEYRNDKSGEVRLYYNQLLRILNGKEKEKLINDQSEWLRYVYEHKTRVGEIYSGENNLMFNDDIMELENECCQYKARAQILEYMYNRISKEK